MITCCKDCVAPKRHVGCHSTCKEYIDEKAKDAELKAKADVDRNIHSARIEGFLKHKDKLAKKQRLYSGYYRYGGK